MTEKFTYTYQDLLDEALSLCKSMYHNVDAYSSTLNVGSKVIFTKNQDINFTGCPSNRSSYVMTKTANLTAIMKTQNYKPALVTSSSISSLFTSNMKDLCEYENISDTVTAKGMLAFMNFLTWFLQKGTIVVQPAFDNTTGLACLVLPSATNYSGLKRGSDELIKKADFESLSWVIGEIASKATYYSDAATYSLSGTSSCSSCSSSCSSSSCSSSCSSSSSSSCSSSSSSAFIAYMKLA